MIRKYFILIFSCLTLALQGQEYRQVVPAIQNYDTSWKMLFFDESAYYTCTNSQFLFHTYYNPNDPNSEQITRYSTISIADEANYATRSWSSNVFTPVNSFEYQASLEEIVPSFNWNGFTSPKVFYILVMYQTYSKSIHTYNSTAPWQNIMVIKRTFYPKPKVGTAFLSSPTAFTKTIEYNTNAGTINGAVATGGNGSFTYVWQKKEGSSTTWSDIYLASSSTYSPGNLTITTKFRRKDTPAVCASALYTNEVTITVLSDVNPGQIGTTQTVCYGTSLSLINTQTGSGGTGSFAYQWQTSNDGSNFWDIIGATDLTYSTPNLMSTAFYRRKCNSGVNFGYSNTVKITVLSDLTSGTISSSQTICYGVTPSQISGTSPTGGDGSYTYKWESSLNGSSWTLISLATASTYQPGALTSSIYYRRTVTSGSGCGSQTSASIAITVYNELSPGIVFRSQSICYNTYPEGLTGTNATGGDGNYSYQWKNSEDGIQWNNVPGEVNANYQPGALSKNTYFRRQVSSSCGAKLSDSVLVEVKAQVNPGTISQSQTVCYNSPPALFSGLPAQGGFDPYNYQWQYSTDNVLWNDISGATEEQYQGGNLITPTYFRRKVYSPTCGNFYSNALMINIAAKPPTPVVIYHPFYCERENVILEADNGAFTYQWYDANGNLILTGSQFTISNVLENELIYCRSKNNGSCQSDPQTISILVDKVKADFSTNVSQVGEGEPVKFYNHSTNATSYLWNFSEGEKSTVEEPWHIFNDSGTKTITLIATTEKGCSDTITQSNLVVTSATGIDNHTSGGYWVYPNPVFETLYINRDENSTTAELRLYDSLGRLVHNTQCGKQAEIHMDNYPAGVYLLTIRSNDEVKTIKIVKR